MKKVLTICLMVMMVTMGGSIAAEKKHSVAKTDKIVTLQNMTVEGVVEKVEKKKETGPDPKFEFKLTEEDGTVVFLPKGEIGLDQYVGKKVTVTGQGSNSEKKGKKSRMFKTITKIEKADATPAVPAK